MIFGSLGVQQDALSIINNFLYIIRSDKQVNYKPNSAESTFCSKDATPQQIGIRLSVHQAARNKNVIDVFSSFKMAIPYQQVMRTETAKADAVILEMKARDNKYIPLNFIKGTLPYYHVDNMDFLEDTSDGRLTTHALNSIAFQPHLLKSLDIMELDLPKHCTTKRLQPNIFGNLEN